MSILPDWRIRELAKAGMIEPFEERLVRGPEDAGVISYGLSSYGYDLRAADEWKVFTNAHGNTIVDPKAFDPRAFIDIQANEIVIPPNSFVLARSLEYLRIPDTVMVVALGKSTYARCFSADTRVALVDGRAPTLEEMAEGAQRGERYFGYSVGSHGRVVATELQAPRRVGRDRLLEVTLDDGAVVHATPDHEFLLRDGTLRPAEALRPGTALMPLYRRLHRGYEMTFQPLTGQMLPTHRLADEWNLRHGAYREEPGTHRHHLDGDRLNNNPWNLVRMEAGEHLRLHGALNRADFDPAGHGASVAAAYARLRQDDAWYAAYRASQRRKAVRFWGEGAYETQREALRHRHRARWTDEERQAQRERLAAFWQDNALARQAQGQRSKVAWERDGGARRQRQAEHAAGLRRRDDLTPQTLRAALDATGSIRAAARLLDIDRSAFRRFPEVLAAFRGQGSRTERVNHKVAGVRPLSGEHDVYCLSVPEAGNFALEAGVFVRNCGIVANVTPLEPGWEGHVTLEFSNTTPLPAKMYAFEGCVQLLFFEGKPPETTYRSRSGKYQGQRGVTLPRI